MNPPTPLPPKSNPTSQTGQMWQSSKWHKAAIYGSFYSRAGGDKAQGGDSSIHGDHQIGGHDNTLPTMLQILGAELEDVVQAQAR